MPKKETQEEVVAQFEAIEKIKKRGYTFKNLKYLGSKIDVLITCPLPGHGDFSMRPHNFKSGQGCPKCGEIARKANQHRLTQEEVVDQFEKIEKIKQRGYTFENLKYFTANTSVLVTCNIESHGDFKITTGNFRDGGGCPKCAQKFKAIKQKTPQEEILKQFEEIEKIKKRGYTFLNLVYVNNHTKVSIHCPVEGHGDFYIRPNDFKRGGGCQKCAFISIAQTQKFSQEKIIAQFEEIEKIKQRGYTFTNVKYVNNNTKVFITCNVEGHGDFAITPKDFKTGSGCPCCATGGFKRDKPGIFYYVRINKDGCEAYKPGITNHSVKKRYPTDFKFMTVLRTIEFETGQEAYDFEQSILNDYAYAKWDGILLLQNNGNTELMKYDILGWDN